MRPAVQAHPGSSQIEVTVSVSVWSEDMAPAEAGIEAATTSASTHSATTKLPRPEHDITVSLSLLEAPSGAALRILGMPRSAVPRGAARGGCWGPGGGAPAESRRASWRILAAPHRSLMSCLSQGEAPAAAPLPAGQKFVLSVIFRVQR